VRIAVLAWGSLVWQPCNDHGELSTAGDWQTDGPGLPIEFARISSDGRLTLIVTPGYPHSSRVLWTISGLDDLDAAVANLAARETNAPLDSIHGIGSGRTLGSPHPSVVEVVSAWLGGKPHIDAAVWTGLGPGNGWPAGGWSPERAADHLASLQGTAREVAIEYIRRAPRQIDTPVRRALQAVIPTS